MSDNRLPVYPWQQAIWQHLLAYLQQGRIPQALLLTGRSGVGKRHLAETFAKLMMCRTPSLDRGACGHCQSCTLFAAGTHIDLLVVEPDEPGKAIGIDKIRQLIVKLALKPQFETYRVVIIAPADQLNTASANAFLKCLEEPSERTCIVLLTEKPFRLPATIRSRCQTVHCPTPEHGEAAQWLREHGVAENVDLLLNLAQNAPLVARAYADQKLIEVRRECFADWQAVADRRKSLVDIAEQWHKSDSPELSVLLRWMSDWVADMIKIRYQAESDTLNNPDMKNSLQAFADKLELKGLYRYYDGLLEAQSQASTQLNKQLMLEQLLVAWSQLNTR